MFGAEDLHFVIADKNVSHGGGLTGDDERIDTEPLKLKSEVTGRKRIGDKSGEGRLGDDRILRGRGQPGANQRRAGEDQWIGSGEWIDCRRGKFVEQARAETDAAQKRSKTRLVEINPRASPGTQIDMEQAAVKSVHLLASSVRGENENFISRIDLGVGRAHEVQAVDVASVAADQTFGVDDAADENRAFVRKG